MEVASNLLIRKEPLAAFAVEIFPQSHLHYCLGLVYLWSANVSTNQPAGQKVRFISDIDMVVSKGQYAMTRPIALPDGMPTLAYTRGMNMMNIHIEYTQRWLLSGRQSANRPSAVPATERLSNCPEINCHYHIFRWTGDRQ